ncbi:DUF2695 domain-containing protein [Phyllobacterium sp. YR531]|uniref:DUF2695 domain-containing protein n=1 Tax=Phyllobacterium sp. YR531 TaxID=1144343 RepID=UPI00026F6CFB|nr:DUF2695 domain-containing protein [Phyllobacterium sp. YR531]EJN01624.1 Protein of unknown function (DUF2695) [Phyllobacterium sp. YR531]
MDKAAKKALLKNWKAQEAEKAVKEFPLEDAQLERFFSELDKLLFEAGCSHDLRNSESVIANMELPLAKADALLEWCKANGGFCDCEVIGNTSDHWDHYRRRS